MCSIVQGMQLMLPVNSVVKQANVCIALWHRYVNDAFTCDATRKTATFGNVLPYLQSLDPAHTIIAGNLECAGGQGLMHAPLYSYAVL
jgi:hypothetical protein